MMQRFPQREAEFAYHPRAPKPLLGIVFFTAVGLGLRSEAASNDRGRIINEIVDRSRDSATTFYWVNSWLSFAFVGLAVLALIARLLGPQRLVSAREGLYAPGWLVSREPRFSRYSDVRSISSRSVGRERFLRLVHVTGRLDGSASMLDAKEDFEDFCRSLEQRLARIHSSSTSTTGVA